MKTNGAEAFAASAPQVLSVGRLFSFMAAALTISMSMAAAFAIIVIMSFTMTTAFAFTVMAVATSFAVSMMTVSFSVASSMSSMAAVGFLGQEFSMKTFGELLFSSVPDTQYASFEVKSLSGHREIEVHYDGVIKNLHDGSSFHITVTVQHRDYVSDLKEVFTYNAVNLECVLRKGDLL